MTPESNELLEQLERENGGPIKWRTYAFLLNREGSKIDGIGGLLYIVGDRLIFEDFESQRPRYLVLGSRRKTYTKTKLQVSLDSITSFMPLTRGDALRVMEGKIPLEEVKPPTGIRKLLDRTVHVLRFTEGDPWFCELFDPEGLEDFLEDN